MKAFFVSIFICIITSSYASNYYFSTVSGNDARTASQAQNPSTPWKTLDKLNSFFFSLKPGDSVLLKRGETFYGAIVIKQSGLTASPIVIGAYGLGNKPTITSLVTLNGWVSKGKGIWETTNLSLGLSVNMVLLNGVEQGMGRYPNNNAANNGYLNFESHNGKTSITDNDLNTGINWKGGEVVLRPRHWCLDRNLITAQSGHTISYTNCFYEPFAGYGYFIQNNIKTLDKFGEWYYNPSQKKLSVYFGAENPSSYVLQATSIEDLVSSLKYSNIVFNNLIIKGANGSGFNISRGSGIHIQNCDILFSGKNGITISGHNNFNLQNCTLINQNNNGIDVESGDNAIIKNNKIENTYLIAGMGTNGEGMGIGININSSNSIVDHNEIRNTGFQGIYFNGSDIIIKNNFIDSFCIVKDDGAGIYSTKGAVIFKRRSIIGNIILNAIGNGNGTNDSNKVAAHGIYMDNNASEADIRDNTIANCSNNGINIHNSFKMTMENNTVFNNKIQLNMVEDDDNVTIRNCIINKNILFSKFKDQWVSSLKSGANDIKSFGTFDSNYYARPLDDRIIIYSSYVSSKGSWITQNFDLDGWKQAYGQDKHSKKTAKQILPFKVNSLAGENKFVNGGDFTNDIKGISCSSCILSRGTSGALGAGYLQVAPVSAESSFYGKIGSVSKGKDYVLSYSLKGSAENDMTIGACLKLSGSPYTNITQVQNRKVDMARTENELLFSPSVTASSSSLFFKVDNKSKYYLDNIKLYEAKVKITNPDDSIKFEYNATAVNKSVNLDGNYIDTKGKAYSNKIILSPFTSVILIKTGSSNQNIAPTVSITSPANDEVFTAFSNIHINAAASDKDGSIAKVEFYNGSTLLKTEYKPTYDCIVNNIMPGKYTITAKATDNNGLATTSKPVVFTVPPLNSAPVVSIKTPTVTSGFHAPATIEITAAATDADGSISKVEFYNGDTLITTEYKVPYSYTWQNVSAGNYNLIAKATDNKGLTTTSAGIKVSVKPGQVSKIASSAQSEKALIVSDTLPVKTNMISAINQPGGIAEDSNYGYTEKGKVVSQSDLAKLTTFRLAPNPAVNVIQIYFDGLQISRKANLMIQNTAGAIVKKYLVIITGQKIDVDVTSLIPGIYIICLSGNDFTISKKFLKVN